MQPMTPLQRHVLYEIARFGGPVGNAIHLESRGRSYRETVRTVGQLLQLGLVRATIIQLDSGPDYLRIQLTPQGRSTLSQHRAHLRRSRLHLGFTFALLFLPLLAGALWLSGAGQHFLWQYVQSHLRTVASTIFTLLGGGILMAWWEPWR